MTLAHPWALPLARLGAPVVLAYLHRLHRLKRPIASTILVRVIRDARPASHKRAQQAAPPDVARDDADRAARGAVRARRPARRSQHGARVIVVLDRSASMGTHDGRLDRLTRRRRGREAPRRAHGDDDEIALVTAGGAPAIEVAPTRHHADVLVRDRCGRATRRDRRQPRRRARVPLADGLCRDAARTTIVIASDGGVTVPPTKCQHPGAADRPRGQQRRASRASLSTRSTASARTTSTSRSPRRRRASRRHADRRRRDRRRDRDGHPAERPGGADRPRDASTAATCSSRRSRPAMRCPLDDRAEAPLASDGPVSVLLVTAQAAEPHRRGAARPPARRARRRRARRAAGDRARPDRRRGSTRRAAAAGHARRRARRVARCRRRRSRSATPRRTRHRALGLRRAVFRYVDLRDLIIQSAHVVTGGHSIADSASGPMICDGRRGASAGS